MSSWLIYGTIKKTGLKSWIWKYCKLLRMLQSNVNFLKFAQIKIYFNFVYRIRIVLVYFKFLSFHFLEMDTIRLSITYTKWTVSVFVYYLFIRVKGRPHGRTRGYFTSYFCTCTTFLASYTHKSTCACTSTTSSNHVGFLCVVHVYDVQMYELAFFKWAYYHRWRFKSNGVLQDIHYKLFYILIFSALNM